MISFYDDYKNRIEKVAKVKKALHKFRFLILGLLVLLIGGISALLATKGMVMSEMVIDPVTVFGQQIGYTPAQAFLVSTDSAVIEYSPVDREEWKVLGDEPIRPGDYKARTVIPKIAGVGYSSTVNFKVNPLKVTLYVTGNSVTYGENPAFAAKPTEAGASDDLYTGHRVDSEAVAFEYADYGAASTEVSFIEDTVRIIDENGVDYKDCYDLSYESATLNVAKKNITLLPEGGSFVYDGVEIEYVATLTDGSSGSIAYGDTVTGMEAAFSGNLPAGTKPINAGNYTVSLDSTKLRIMHGDVDVTSRYNITFATAQIIVDRRAVTVTTGSFKGTYDGDGHGNETPVYDASALVSGHVLEVKGDPFTQKSATSDEGVDNTTEYAVMRGANDESDNYEITYVYGKIVIDKRPIVITTDTVEREYNGYELSSSEATGDNLVDGHTVKTYAVTPSLHNVGKVDNVFECIIENTIKTNMTSNYAVTYEYGTLEITPFKLTVTTSEAEKVYDGDPLCTEEDDKDTLFDRDLSGFKVVSEFISITNFGEDRENAVKLSIYFNGISVKENFEITEEFGTLKIKKRPIIVTTATSSSVYDGKPYFDYSYKATYTDEDGYEYEGLCGDDELTVRDGYKTVTFVTEGEVENVCLYDIPSANYEIEDIVNGYISVTKRHIVVETASDKHIYDGNGFSNTADYHTWLYDSESGADLKDKEGLVTVEATGVKDTLEVTFTYVTGVSAKQYVNETRYSANGNYEIERHEDGLLIVSPRPVVIKTASNDWIYDGTTHEDNSYEKVYYYDTENNRIDESKAGIITGDPDFAAKDNQDYPEKITDVGTILNQCQFAVEGNYTLVVTATGTTNGYIYGTLEVTPRPLFVTTASDGRVYNGKPLTASEPEFVAYALETDDKWVGVEEVDGRSVEGLVVNALTGVRDALILVGNAASVTNYYDSNNGVAHNNTCVYASPIGSLGKANYEIKGYFYGTLTVEQREIEVSLLDLTAVFGDEFTYEATAGNYKVDAEHPAPDLADGESLTIGKVGYYRAIQDGDGIILTEVLNKQEFFVGSYIIAVDPEFTLINGDAERAGNYDITYRDGALTITQKYLTVKVTDISSVYGDDLPTRTFTVYNGAASDVLDGDGKVKPTATVLNNTVGESTLPNGDVISITLAFDPENPKDVGEYAIKITAHSITDGYPFGDAGGDRNYEIDYVDGMLEITPRDVIVVTGTGSRTYNGQDFSLPTLKVYYAVNNGTDWVKTEDKAGLVGADEFIIDLSTVKTVRNVSEGKIKNNFNWSIPQGIYGENNYAVRGAEYGTIEITTAPLTIVLNDIASVTYGEQFYYADAKGNYASGTTGLVNGEDLTVKIKYYQVDEDGNSTPLTGAPQNRGTYVAALDEQNTVVWLSDGTELDYGIHNYDITCDNLTGLTIARRVIFIEIDDKTYDYGYAFDDMEFTFSAFYQSASGDKGAPVCFGEPCIIGNCYNEELKLSYRFDLGTEEGVTPRNAGTYKITVAEDGYLIDGSANGADNYDFRLTDASLKIEKLKLKLKLDDFEKVYGEDVPTEKLGFSAQNGETIVYGYGETLEISAKYFYRNTTTRVARFNVSVYDLAENGYTVRDADGEKIDGGENNYEIECLSGLLTVSKKNIYIEIGEETVDYGDPIPAEYDFKIYEAMDGEGNFIGEIVNGELPFGGTFEITEYTYSIVSGGSLENGRPRNVGEYGVQGSSHTLTCPAVDNPFIDEDASGNYIFYFKNGKLNIEKRNVTVQLEHKDLVYGATVVTSKVDYTLISGGTAGHNGALQYNETLSIAPAFYLNGVLLTETPKNAATYTMVAQSLTVSGNGADEASEAFADGSDYKCELTNYVVTIISDTLTIAPRKLSLSISDIADVVYGNTFVYADGIGNYENAAADPSYGVDAAIFGYAEQLKIAIKYSEILTDGTKSPEIVMPVNAGTYAAVFDKENCTVYDRNGVEIVGGINNYEITCPDLDGIKITPKSISVYLLDISGVKYGDFETNGRYPTGEGNYKGDTFAPALEYGDTLEIASVTYHLITSGVAATDGCTPRAVGTYAIYAVEEETLINGTTDLLKNYDIAFIGGELEIVRKEITVTLSDMLGLVYGEFGATENYSEDVENYASAVGLAYGEKLLVTVEYYACDENGIRISSSPVDPKTSGVGLYDIALRSFTVYESDGVTEVVNGDGNYDASGFVCGRLEINKLSVTLTIESPTITYGDELPTAVSIGQVPENLGYGEYLSLGNLYYYVMVGGEEVEVSEPANHGTYFIGLRSYSLYAEDGAAASEDNYDIEVDDGELTIEKKKITVTVTVGNRYDYGEELPDSYNFAITDKDGQKIDNGKLPASDVRFGETLQITGFEYYPITEGTVGTQSVVPVNAGTYAVRPAGYEVTGGNADAENYEITPVDGVLYLDKLAVVLKTNEYVVDGREYGDTDIPVSDSVDRVIPGDGGQPDKYIPERDEITVYLQYISGGVAVTPKDAGEYGVGIAKIVITNADGTEEVINPAADLYVFEFDNYVISMDGFGSFEITPKTISSVTLPSLTGGDALTYNGKEAPEYYDLDGVLEYNETLRVYVGYRISGSADECQAINKGEYDVFAKAYAVWDGATESGNGDLTLKNYIIENCAEGELTINAASLEITLSDKTATYGDYPDGDDIYGVALDNATASGLAAGEHITVLSVKYYAVVGGEESATACNPQNAGSYAIRENEFKFTNDDEEEVSADNYSVVWYAGALTVSEFALTVTVADTECEYGDALPVPEPVVAETLPYDEELSLGFGIDYNGQDPGRLPVGFYDITVTSESVTGGNARVENYDIDYTLGQLEVKRRKITVVVDSKNCEYGEEIPANTFKIYEYADDDTRTEIVNGNLAGYGETLNVTSYNYFAIIGGVTDKSHTVTPSDVGSYEIAVASADIDGEDCDLNYKISWVEGNLTIGEVELVITFIGTIPVTAAYGDDYTAALNAAFRVEGHTQNETIELAFTIAPAATTFGLKRAAAARAARILGAGNYIAAFDWDSCKLFRNGVEVDGGMSNYTLASTVAPVEFTIERKQITVTLADIEHEYDGTEYDYLSAANAYTVEGLVDGDEIELEVGYEPSSHKNVGYYFVEVIDAAINGMGYFDTVDGKLIFENYEATFVDGSLNVYEREVGVTVNSYSKAFGEDYSYPDTAGNCALTVPLADGEFIKISVRFEKNGTAVTGVLDAGTYDIKYVDYTICDEHGVEIFGGKSNYTVVSVDGVLTVDPCVITVARGGASFVYNGGEQGTEDYTVTDGTLLAGYEIVVDTPFYVVDATTGFGGTDGIANATTFKVVYRANAGDNPVDTVNYVVEYDLIANGKIVITPRPIIVTTGDATDIYTGNALMNTAATSVLAVLNGGNWVAATGDDTVGVLEGDSYLVLSGNPASVTNYFDANNGVTGNNVNAYQVPTGSNGFANYEIVDYVYGTLTVNQREIVFETLSDSKVYDGQPLTAGYKTYLAADGTQDGLLGTDEFILTSAQPSQTAVGTRVNRFDVDVPNSNYIIVRRVTGTLEVTVRHVTINALSDSKTYDGSELLGGFEIVLTEDGSVAGLVSGDESSITVDEDSIESITDAGSVTYTVSYTLADGNYEVDANNAGTLTVNAKEITVALHDLTVGFDEYDFATDEVYEIALENAAADGLIDGQRIKITAVSYFAIDLAGNTSATPVTPEEVGKYAIKQNGFAIFAADGVTAVNSGNYTIAWTDGQLEIQGISIFITRKSVTKVYDGTPLEVTEDDAEVTYSRIIGGETVTGDGIPADIGATLVISTPCKTDGANVTTINNTVQYAVYKDGAEYRGARVYYLDDGNQTVSITPATLTVSLGATVKTVTYGDTFAVSVSVEAGLVAGETITNAENAVYYYLSGDASKTAVAAKNAADYVASLDKSSLQVAGTLNPYTNISNYTLSFSDLDGLTIERRNLALAIEWTDGADYNGSAHFFAGSVTATGGTAFAYDDESSVAVGVEYYSDAACTDRLSQIVNAGTYFVKLIADKTTIGGVAATLNYDLADSDSIEYVIYPAKLTITLNSGVESEYGAGDYYQKLTQGAVSGLVAGDTLDIALKYYLASDSGMTNEIASPANVAGYIAVFDAAATTMSVGLLSNYTFDTDGDGVDEIVANATFEIIPKTINITVSLGTETKVYDGGNAPQISVDNTALAAGDDIEIEVYYEQNGVKVDNPVNAGEYEVALKTVLIIGGVRYATHENYNLVVNGGNVLPKLTIEKKGVSVTLHDFESYYGDTADEGGYPANYSKFTGKSDDYLTAALVGDDYIDVTVSYTGGYHDHSPAVPGTYSITFATLTLNGETGVVEGNKVTFANYEVFVTDGTITVHGINVYVTRKSLTKPYDGSALTVDESNGIKKVEHDERDPATGKLTRTDGIPAGLTLAVRRAASLGPDVGTTANDTEYYFLIGTEEFLGCVIIYEDNGSASLTIDKAELKIELSVTGDKSVVYGDTFAVNASVLSGLVNGESITNINSAVYYYLAGDASKAATEAKNAGNYVAGFNESVCEVAGGKIGNYEVIFTELEGLTIERRALTLAISMDDAEYTGVNHGFDGTVTAIDGTSTAYGESVSASVDFFDEENCRTALAQVINAGTYYAKLIADKTTIGGVAATLNYDLSDSEVIEFVVNRAKLSIALNEGIESEYGSDDYYTKLTQGAVSGLVAGETVNIALKYFLANDISFADAVTPKNVGNYVAVYDAAATLARNAETLKNYTLDLDGDGVDERVENISFKVNRKSISVSVTIDRTTIEYGDTTPDIRTNNDSPVAPDTLDIETYYTKNGIEYEARDAGEYQVVAIITINGEPYAAASNYAVTVNGGEELPKLTIEKKKLSLALANRVVEYGTAESESDYPAENLKFTNVSGDGYGDAALVYGDELILTIKYEDSFHAKVPALAGDYRIFVETATIGREGGRLEDGVFIFDNYEITIADGNLRVLGIVVTVEREDIVKPYDGKPIVVGISDFTVTYSKQKADGTTESMTEAEFAAGGFVLSLSSFATPTADVQEIVNGAEFTVLRDGVKFDGCVIVDPNKGAAKLIIEKRDLKVELNTISDTVYGKTFEYATGTGNYASAGYTGEIYELIAGEELEVVIKYYRIVNGQRIEVFGAPKLAGEYVATIDLTASVVTGGSLGNYEVDCAEIVGLTIEKRDLTLAIDWSDEEYTGADHAFAGSCSVVGGSFGWDDESAVNVGVKYYADAACTVELMEIVNAGKYYVKLIAEDTTIGGEKATINYNLADSAAIEFNITKKALNISLNEGVESEYGADDYVSKLLDGAVNGLVAGESIELGLNFNGAGALVRPDKGTYTVAIDGITFRKNGEIFANGLDNYEVSYGNESVTFEITAKTLNVTVTIVGGNEITYGDAVPDIEATIDGAAYDDQAYVTAEFAEEVINAGTYALTVTAGVNGNADNYVILYNGASDLSFIPSLTVHKKQISLAVKDHAIDYGASDDGYPSDYLTFTAAEAGLVNGDGLNITVRYGESYYDKTPARPGEYAIIATGASIDAETGVIVGGKFVFTNYEVTLADGTMTVRGINVYIERKSDDKVYDGTAITPDVSDKYVSVEYDKRNPDGSFTRVAGVPDGMALAVATDGSLGPDVGKINNLTEYCVMMGGAINEGCLIIYTDGGAATLEITKAPLEVRLTRSGTASVTYGATFTVNASVVSGLVNGETIENIDDAVYYYLAGDAAKGAVEVRNVGNYVASFDESVCTVTGGKIGNYEVSFNEVAGLQIIKRALSLKTVWNDEEYTGAHHAFAGTYSVASGSFAYDDADSVSIGVKYYADSACTDELSEIVRAGTYYIKLIAEDTTIGGLAATVNYSITDGAATAFGITKKALSISLNSGVESEYGTNDYGEKLKANSVTGLVAGETLDYSVKYYLASDATQSRPLAAPRAVESYVAVLDTASVSMADDGLDNYELSFGETEVAFEITEKTVRVSVSLSGGNTIVYGDDAPEIITDNTPLIDLDEITIDVNYTYNGEQVANPVNAGEYPVEAVIKINGSDYRGNTNYVVVVNGGRGLPTLKIERKRISVTLADLDIEYGESADYPDANLTFTDGFVGGDTLTVTMTYGAEFYEYDPARPGKYAISAVTATIGSENVTDNGGAFEFVNYEVVVVDGTLTVHGIEVFITRKSVEKVYDGGALTADASADYVSFEYIDNVTGERLSGVPAGLTVAVRKAAAIGPDVGSVENDTEYYFLKGGVEYLGCHIEYLSEDAEGAFLEITKASLNVALSVTGDKTVSYGNTFAVNASVISGLVNGESISASDLKAAVCFYLEGDPSAAVSEAKNAGRYVASFNDADCVVTGGKITNYEVTFNEIKDLEITKVTLTATIAFDGGVTSFAYGDIKAPQATISGCVAGESITPVISYGNAWLFNGLPRNVGSYVAAIDFDACTVNGNGISASTNYELQVVPSLSFEIIKRNVSIAIDGDIEIEYGDKAEPSYRITTGLTEAGTLPYGEEIKISVIYRQNGVEKEAKFPGEYDIIAKEAETEVTGGSVDNYDIAYSDGSLKISARALTVKASDVNVEYGDSGLNNSYEMSGELPYGDLLDASGISYSYYAVDGEGAPTGTIVNPKAAGKYAIKINGSVSVKDVDGNDVSSCYDLTVASGTLTIEKKTLTVRFEALEFDYGTAVPASPNELSASVLDKDGNELTALPYGETLSIVSFSYRVQPKDAGSYDFTPVYAIDGGDAGLANYTIRNSGAKVKVNPVDLKLDVNNDTVELYYGTDVETAIKVNVKVVSGIVAGDEYVAAFKYYDEDGKLVRGIPVNAGTYTVKIDLAGSRSSKFNPNNYTLTDDSVKEFTLVIKTFGLNITLPTSVSKDYDGLPYNFSAGIGADSDITHSSLVAGDAITFVPSSTPVDAGDYTISFTVKVTGPDGSDRTESYDVSFNGGETVDLKINKRKIKVTIEDCIFVLEDVVDNGKTYTAAELTCTPEFIPSDMIGLTFLYDGSEVMPKSLGEYTVGAKFTGDKVVNYEIEIVKTGRLKIVERWITMTPEITGEKVQSDGAYFEVPYGEDYVAGFTQTLAAGVGNLFTPDELAALTVTYRYYRADNPDVEIARPTAVGRYIIKIEVSGASNAEIELEEATLVIRKRVIALDVPVIPSSFEYTGAAPAGLGSATLIDGGDGLLDEHSSATSFKIVLQDTRGNVVTSGFNAGDYFAIVTCDEIANFTDCYEIGGWVDHAVTITPIQYVIVPVLTEHANPVQYGPSTTEVSLDPTEFEMYRIVDNSIVRVTSLYNEEFVEINSEKLTYPEFSKSVRISDVFVYSKGGTLITGAALNNYKFYTAYNSSVNAIKSNFYMSDFSVTLSYAKTEIEYSFKTGYENYITVDGGAFANSFAYNGSALSVKVTGGVEQLLSLDGTLMTGDTLTISSDAITLGPDCGVYGEWFAKLLKVTNAAGKDVSEFYSFVPAATSDTDKVTIEIEPYEFTVTLAGGVDAAVVNGTGLTLSAVFGKDVVSGAYVSSISSLPAGIEVEIVAEKQADGSVLYSAVVYSLGASGRPVDRGANYRAVIVGGAVNDGRENGIISVADLLNIAKSVFVTFTGTQPSESDLTLVAGTKYYILDNSGDKYFSYTGLDKYSFGIFAYKDENGRYVYSYTIYSEGSRGLEDRSAGYVAEFMNAIPSLFGSSIPLTTLTQLDYVTNSITLDIDISALNNNFAGNTEVRDGHTFLKAGAFTVGGDAMSSMTMEIVVENNGGSYSFKVLLYKLVTSASGRVNVVDYANQYNLITNVSAPHTVEYVAYFSIYN